MEVFLSEVFASIQGEGAGAGRPAWFVRLAGCNLRCSYCDTPGAQTVRPPAFMLHAEGSSREVANPIDCRNLVRVMEETYERVPLAVITGGEPLLQPGAVADIGNVLKAMGMMVLLETNGTLPGALAGAVDSVDLVAMDVKLPSSQGGSDQGALHTEFLKGIDPRKVVAKIVIPAGASDREVMEAVDLVARRSRRIKVFLQPVFGKRGPKVDGRRLLKLLAGAGLALDDVRISVQMHRVLGIR
jgi:7-carboxy-7-deazaguanine synthase